MITSKTNEDSNANFSQKIMKIGDIFQKYSVTDISRSLFTLNTWLPNISSQVKQLLLYTIFLRIPESKFSIKDIILKYSDFELFLRDVLPHVPEFPYLEDYVPENDWGEVKFHHNNKDYKILYGNELPNIYDYLLHFQFVYCSRDKDYFDLESVSPSQELQQILALQEAIILGIPQGSKPNNLSVEMGDLKVPSQAHWESCVEFLESFNPKQYASEKLINDLSCKIGCLLNTELKEDIFGEAVFRGKQLPFFFVKFAGSFIPLLPRRFTPIFLERWASIFKKHESTLRKDDSYEKILGADLFDFLRGKIGNDTVLPFVCAVKKDGKPHEIVYACSFLSKSKLILFYFLAPFSDDKEVSVRIDSAIPKIEESLSLIRTKPVTLGLRSRGQLTRFEGKSKDDSPVPEVFIVLPETSTEVQGISLKQDPPGRIVFLDQLLGVLDEIDKPREFSDFLEYLKENESKIVRAPYSLQDKYGSFKDSSGVLISGARDVNVIMIDPHWGSNFRFKTLKKFWALYPENGLFDHPRNWKIQKISNVSVRLIAKGYFGSVVYLRILSCDVFITSPFEEMSYEQGSITDLLIQALEDGLRRNGNLFEQLQVFKSYKQIHINLFPWSLIKTHERLKHLYHLDPKDNRLKSDYGQVKPGTPGIRVVFNDKLLFGLLETVKDASFEIELLCEVLTNFNQIAPDSKHGDILSKIRLLSSKKPRFKLFREQKKVSFPQFVSPQLPSNHFLKEASKSVAIIAKSIGLLPKRYDLHEAEVKLNLLRDGLINEINKEVTKYGFDDSIRFLIEKIDALISRYEEDTSQIKHSTEHEIDFNPEKRFAKKHINFLTWHRAYRYLIEKFVQINPKGPQHMDNDGFQFLVSLVDRLLQIYSTSDSIHYGIYQAGVIVNADYLTEIEYIVDLAKMQKDFSEDDAKIRLGILGDENDRVESRQNIEEFLSELDDAFFTDLGFHMKNMINILHILSQWPLYFKAGPEGTWYEATSKQIAETAAKAIKGLDIFEIPKILEFLTLKSNEVVTLVGIDEVQSNIPVWEHRKRSSRYMVKPVIKTRTGYLWGPYSAMRAGITWTSITSDGQLPYDMQSPSIQASVDKEKKLIENALVDKTKKIVERFTGSVEENLYLYKRDPNGGWPDDLGDFDVLAYIPEKNTFLNIEDKDILPAYCLKDIKKIRDERIFGRSKTDLGYLGKVERRAKFLEKNYLGIAKFLGWKLQTNKHPRVISLFVSRTDYWWTKFPPRGTDVIFLRIDLLNDYLKKII